MTSKTQFSLTVCTKIYGHTVNENWVFEVISYPLVHTVNENWVFEVISYPKQYAQKFMDISDWLPTGSTLKRKIHWVSLQHS